LGLRGAGEINKLDFTKRYLFNHAINRQAMEQYLQNVDLSFLKGRELLQVCVGQFQLQFLFTGKIKIFTECGIKFFDKNITHELSSSPESAAFITPLIGNSIIDFEVSSDGTLKLHFSNGQNFALYNDQSGYEYYQINHDETVIVPPRTSSDWFPYGYWRLCNEYGQPIDPSTGKPGPVEGTHVPYPDPTKNEPTH